MIGRTISHYRVINQLGAGGMGVVYGADDTRLGRQVALKFVPEDLAKDRLAMERFRVEARTASALNHANICTIYDIGEHEGRPFIVMEWMKGQTLRDRLVRGVPKISQIVDIGIQIADALHAAHAQGIVHRDIKPANIFLTERGQVKVMDFGLAKLLPEKDGSQTTGVPKTIEALTSPGMALGTVAYMSPEQVVGDEIDVRTDLFSLGVLLYECATGHRPFTGNSSAAIFVAILNKAPVAPMVLNPDMPMRLQVVINNCLEKDPDLRYQNAADLRADLKRVKRDFESSRSVVSVSTSEMRAGSGVATDDRGSGGTSLQPDHTTPSARSAAPSGSEASHSGSLRLAGSVIAAVVLGAAVASYLLWPGVPTTSERAVVGAPAAASADSRAELAARSFEAKQYGTALKLAEEVLTTVPDHAGARKIRDESSAILRRFDTAITNARAGVSTGDTRSAARWLDEARSIDPVGPGVADVSALLADRIERQADAARQELQRPRTAAPAPAPAPAPAQASKPQLPPPAQAPREATPEPAPALVRSSPVSPPPAPPVPRQEDPPRVVAPEPIVPAVRSAPPPAPAAAERRESEPPAQATPPAENDDAAIRSVIAVYERALETKDLALFRSVKPNITADEARRIEQGFRAVASQQVTITILSLERRGTQASVRLRRRDIIDAGGRKQAADSQQTITLAKTNGRWVIVEIGR